MTTFSEQARLDAYHIAVMFILACEKMMPSSSARLKQKPFISVFQAALIGRHCAIQRMVITMFESKRKIAEACRGRTRALEVGIRIRNRHKEILVHINVAKVWIHSP